MNRRTTLLGMLAACGAGLVHKAANALATNDTADAPAPHAKNDDTMQADLSRMGSHEYSDEGIPVFLACVDWAAEKAGRPTPPASSEDQHLAAELRRYGDAWRQMHPDAPDTDASKIIEVLAERDFAAAPTGDHA